MQNFIVLKMRIVSILYAVTKSLLTTYRPNVNLSFLVLLSSDTHDNNGGMIWFFTVLHYRKIKCLSHRGVKLLMSYSFISGIQDKKRQQVHDIAKPQRKHYCKNIELNKTHKFLAELFFLKWPRNDLHYLHECPLHYVYHNV